MYALTRVVLTQLALRRLFRKGGSPIARPSARLHCSRCNSDWKTGITRCLGCGAALDQGADANLWS